MDVSKVMAFGAAKYGVKNWRKQPIRASTYYSAMLRHLIAWYEYSENDDRESSQPHLAHVIANCMILLDAQEQGTLIDDRDFSEILGK